MTRSLMGVSRRQILEINKITARSSKQANNRYYINPNACGPLWILTLRGQISFFGS